MKALVCGSRSFNDNEKASMLLSHNLAMLDIYHIISGGAKGADTLAKEWAKKHDVPITEVKPDWDKYGKSAGFRRNETMINMKPDMVIALWDGESKGTKHTISLAKQHKIITLIIYV